MESSASLSHLLRFHIGPVQEFIAQARSTRDLWSGSYLLSWLVAAGIRKLQAETDAEMIYPNLTDQPLLQGSFDGVDSQVLLTPNLPNILVARVPAAASESIAKAVAAAISAEWRRIATAVWEARAPFGLQDGMKDRFDAQVARHLSISWVVTPTTGADATAYVHDYRLNGWQMGAVRQTHDFRAWHSGGWHTRSCEKDSLSGREESIVGGKEWQADAATKYPHLFKHPDPLGAVNFIKRVWHLAFLQHERGFGAAVEKFKILSTLDIAARTERGDDEGEDIGLVKGEKYLAAIAFDGDAIGSWSQGEFLPPGADLHAHHQQFGACLSQFALHRVRSIVEGHAGFLIYAGGDDVLALVPADAALQCAKALRLAFQEVTQEIQGRDLAGKPLRPDASAGIAIAHFKFPLQDLIRAARDAEGDAKSDIGRPAFSVTLMKRSGEIEKWGAKWESHGLELHEALAAALSQRHLSGRFPHRVCELLEPYLNSRTGMRTQKDAAQFPADEVILQEFAHALERQSPKALITQNQTHLLPLLQDYLDKVRESWEQRKALRAGQEKPETVSAEHVLLSAVIGLCKSVAFIHRNRSALTQPKGTSAS